jgi:hypothetical protein
MFDDLQPWQNTILWVINLCGFLFILWLNTKFVTRSEHDALNKGITAQLNTHSSKLAEIENTIKHMPSAEDVQNLSLQISDLKGELKMVNVKFENGAHFLDRLQIQMDRMEDFLGKINK